MSSIRKNIMQTLKTVVLAFLLIAGVNYTFAVDWTAPTSGPVGGNTSAPLNVSVNGQAKEAGLILNTSQSAGQGLVVMSALTPYALTVHNSDGFVGVGVLQATESLDIFGKIRIRGGTPGAGKVLTSDATGSGTWQTPASGGSSLWTAGASNSISNSNTGNVGIGTVDPETKLEVKGTGNQYIKLTSTASNVDIASKYTDSANNVSVFSGLLGAAAGAGKWGVYNGATRMVVDNAGNVGIGTNNPVNKLHVMGGAYMQGNVSIGGSVTPSKALEVGGSVSINGQLRIGEVGGGSTPAAGRVLTSLDGSGNASWKPGIEVAIGGANSTQVCSLTPNKRFLVTAYGKALVPGNGASTLVVNANGVIGQDNLVGIPNNYDKFVVPIVTNSDSSGCINYNAYISGGPGGNVTIMNVSIVG